MEPPTSEAPRSSQAYPLLKDEGSRAWVPSIRTAISMTPKRVREARPNNENLKGGSLFLVPCSLFLVLGAWFLVLGSWFLVLGSWFLVLGAWFLVLGSWFLVLGAWFLVGGGRGADRLRLRLRQDQGESRQSCDERRHERTGGASAKSPLPTSGAHGPEVLWRYAKKGPLECGPSSLEQGFLPARSATRWDSNKAHRPGESRILTFGESLVLGRWCLVITD